MSKVIEQGGFKFKKDAQGRVLVFDSIRNKFVVNTPEEWVRQTTIQYFHEELGFPKSVLAVEKQFQLYRRKKRTDLVAYDSNGNPMILVECKRPSVRISQETFDQAFRYNIELKIPFVVITNGEEMYCCQQTEPVTFLKDIPKYDEVCHLDL